MPDFTIKQHDRLPSIQATLRGPAIAPSTTQPPIDLTGAMVKFILKSASTPTIKVNAMPVTVDAVRGVVRYDWAAGDTDTAGSYLGEWEVTFTSGKKQTFPTDSYHDIAIVADLDGA